MIAVTSSPGRKSAVELETAGLLSVLLLSKHARRDGCFAVQLHGLSMSPYFKEGQTVTVDCAPQKSFGIGDVIVFQMAGRLCAHRVLARRRRDGERCYVQKGDNQLSGSIVSHDEVLGKVVGVDGCPLPLSVGMPARVAMRFYAMWAYGLSSLPALLRSAPLKQATRKFPAIETGARRLCLRASRGFLRVLLSLFHTTDTKNI
jgi:signal peptidase I